MTLNPKSVEAQLYAAMLTALKSALAKTALPDQHLRIFSLTQDGLVAINAFCARSQILTFTMSREYVLVLYRPDSANEGTDR